MFIKQLIGQREKSLLAGDEASTKFAHVAKTGSRRHHRKPANVEERRNELGSFLCDLRAAKRLSLRDVEEATDGAVSNAYLSQVENGKIRKPSPNVLHSLAEVYAVPYEALMERAGYLVPTREDAGRQRKMSRIFAIDDLTADEEKELLKYLAFLRSRGTSGA